MKLLLTKDVPGIGRAGDVKDVSDGHARNFLIPKHLALPATSGMLAKVQKEEQEKQAKVAKLQDQALELKTRLENRTFTVKAKADKTHLFAALKESQIAEAINSKMNLNISPDQILIEKPLKSLGLHKVEIRFAENTKAKVKLNIEAI